MNRRRSSNSTASSASSIITVTSSNSTQSSMNTFDHQSVLSTRKASRLSNLNPMKPRSVSGKSDMGPIASHQNGPNGHIASHNSYYNLTPMSTNSLTEINNYHLTKMDTNDSIDSNFSLQSQFKIELNMSRKEIELIRFTWHKMLLEEPVVQTESSLPIPGGFRFGDQSNSLQQQASQHQQSDLKPANNIASSLFCRQLYGNLLNMNPTLEKLFPSIKHQAVAFAGVMSFTISQMENLAGLNEYLESLGKRHSRILGIEPSMFELMGEAMIQTFHERFGTKFNQELEILWIKLYMYLANSLLQFGIDPILKLNTGDNSHDHHGSSGLFRLNEISQPAVRTPSAPSSAKEDLFSVADGKRSSVSTGSANTSFDLKKKDKGMNKKKRDCVVQ
ncbi:hypothetical protein CANTEDRAFT_114341 [Yamadazyma tenuis ATCC 10573]|uniref:Globin-like protein n=1 Tax=Candida tenuis (strain ATCC 10573 / BCRC 21748 / CBS 615 / JCM 9827 / NBRC 10315 / NRRL Y-1498 / VKM Y-70) TaxID=590646 RepID=G3B6W4_CANTC|nr:globin-like protein [Yamadazyma tenuis ATCC 10573]XP_006687314.1 uncharacterized protein CANTEDRAFT_114341 [Yamadazyma tenuis ATCC 10573]EGV63520.1 globin-like protein [Yamadazyma tenuis ATCC 10573]EGV63521.1 hypothetical protein CANTEDRAFT_114341 [Yamadazyma tenuis ATCC 10573]